MRRVVITHALRTPIGKFMGCFSEQSGVDLGVEVVSVLKDRAQLAADDVGLVVFGNARQAGGGPNPARQIAIRSGFSDATVSWTINMACASGLRAIGEAAQDIAQGMCDVAVAGGTESMTRLPYLLPRARDGQRLGNTKIVDAMYQDGFECPLADQLMGRTAETLAEQHEIPRSEQDAWALRSQHKAEAAWNEGRFDAEVVSVTITNRKGSVTIDRDEHPRAGSTIEGLAKLEPVFKKDGTVHAGNSSGITDGAAAVVLMAEETAAARGLEVLAVLEGHAAAGVDPKIMGIGPVPATARLLEMIGGDLASFDLIELNEAFAAQVIACLREWGGDEERINVNGGAIALGHPIGATGARIVVTLLHEMKRRDARRGLATLCVSGGMGQSMAFAR